jgi:hypothetical protein
LARCSQIVTIEREYYGGPIVFHCDGRRCAEVCETHCNEFSGALAKAKSRGWRAVKVGDEWEHFCPDEELPK